MLYEVITRPGEVDGSEYHFVDVSRFRALRDAGEFLEWAEVHGNYYGTSKAWLRAELDAGHDTLLEIDWQGAQQVRKVFPEAVGIFILPPSMEELERRITSYNVCYTKLLRGGRPATVLRVPAQGGLRAGDTVNVSVSYNFV